MALYGTNVSTAIFFFVSNMNVLQLVVLCVQQTFYPVCPGYQIINCVYFFFFLTFKFNISEVWIEMGLFEAGGYFNIYLTLQFVFRYVLSFLFLKKIHIFWTYATAQNLLTVTLVNMLLVSSWSVELMWIKYYNEMDKKPVCLLYLIYRFCFCHYHLQKDVLWMICFNLSF